jgi:hypothetical protein
MTCKHYCVTDKKGRYVTYVLKIDDTVVAYQLKKGERLLDAMPPLEMENPRWDGEAWIEADGAE